MESSIQSLNEELRNDCRTRTCRATLEEDMIVVTGRTTSYFQKQIAIHLTMKWAGEKYRLKFNIDVGRT